MLTSGSNECFNCGKKGHMARDCRQSRRQQNSNRQRQQGDTANDQQICFNFERDAQCRYGDKCRFKHSGDKGQQSKGTKTRFDRAFITIGEGDQCLITPHKKATNDSEQWLAVDTAAELHVINSSQLASNLKNKTKTKDTMFMNQYEVKITARGNLDFEHNGKIWKLKNVAYVPASKYNLLSISALLDVHRDGVVTHTRKKVIIQDGKHKIVGHRKRGLYFISTQKKKEAMATHDNKDSESEPERSSGSAADSEENYYYDSSEEEENKHDSRYSCFNTNNPFSLLVDSNDSNKKDSLFTTPKANAILILQRLHRKWGHVGLRACRATIMRDQKELGISDIQMKEIFTLTKHDVGCDSCLLAKSRRKHPKGARRRRRRTDVDQPTTDKQRLSHQMTADTFGPNPSARRTGARYGHVTVFDDEAYSKVTFSKRKSGAGITFRDNYRVWRHEASTTLGILKTDRGGEWNSKSFNHWCKKRGLQRKFTAPNSSSGTAEKKIDTLQTLSMSMRNWAQLPADTGLWEESIKYANTITLFVPSSAKRLHGLSPWEKRHGERPRMHALHSWGCLAYPNISAKERRRFENRARRAMFVGLADNEDDGYRFWDDDKKSFFTSKSAEFREDLPYYAWKKREKHDLQQALKEDKARSKMDAVKRGEQKDNAPSSRQPASARGKRKRKQRQQFDPNAWELAYEHDRQRNQALATTTIVQKLHREHHRREHRSRTQPSKIRSPYGCFNTTSTRNKMPLPRGMVPEGAEEALQSEDREYWKKAMAKEISSLLKKKVMRACSRRDVPRGKRIIKTKWVFSIKKNADGSIERYKARLVAKGFMQRYGYDYTDTFAPTPDFTSVRLIVGMALQNRWKVWHEDVETWQPSSRGRWTKEKKCTARAFQDSLSLQDKSSNTTSASTDSSKPPTNGARRQRNNWRCVAYSNQRQTNVCLCPTTTMGSWIAL
jgi:hypothetical protein